MHPQSLESVQTAKLAERLAKSMAYPSSVASSLLSSKREHPITLFHSQLALGTIFGLPVEPEWRPLIERAAALPG